MPIKEIRVVRRGVSRQEYAEYFAGLGMQVEPGRFQGPGWEVVVGEERQAKLHVCVFQEVEIIFRAEDGFVQELVAAFRLKFMRAGA